MVEQRQVGKTSNRTPEYQLLGNRGLPEYRFPCYAEPVSLVPVTTELKVVDDLGPLYAEGLPGYFISGSLQDTAESWWPEPPHIAFANLLAEDPKAAEAFIKRYGVLHRVCMDKDDADGRRFTIDSAYLLHLQDRLRRAWPTQNSAHISAFVDLEGEVEESFDTDVVVSGGFVHLRPKDLWASICFLYLWDVHAKRLGFCGNPDCPAPYFRKKRRTQKFCEAGPCADYARKKYALRYWDTKGKKKRDKRMKSTKRQGEKRTK